MFFQIDIFDFSYDGCGVVCCDGEGGKVIFIIGVLLGEVVIVELIVCNCYFDEVCMLEVVIVLLQWVMLCCLYFGVCVGCVLQYLEELQQIVVKQWVLMDNLICIGYVILGIVLLLLVGDSWGYCCKGWFLVCWVEKKDKILVGFCEQDLCFVVDLLQCLIVILEIGSKVGVMVIFIEILDGKCDILQIEFIVGDDVIMLIICYMQLFSDVDCVVWIVFGQEYGFVILLQFGGVELVQLLWLVEVLLLFKFVLWDVELVFWLLDFIQVNVLFNVKMIVLVLELFDVGLDEWVFDLFCGLGNFILLLVCIVCEVVGVEGDLGLVVCVWENVECNGLFNVQFYVVDLIQDQCQMLWMCQGFDKLLLDLLCLGVIEVLQQLLLKQFKCIVYVSCYFGLLVCDVGYLVNEQGFILVLVGVMDMFLYIVYVESIVVFEKC